MILLKSQLCSFVCSSVINYFNLSISPLPIVLGGWPMLKKTHTQHRKHWSQLFTQLFSQTGLSPVFRITVQFERHLQKKFLFVSSFCVVTKFLLLLIILIKTKNNQIAPGGTGVAPDTLLNPLTHQKAIDAYKQYIRVSAIAMGAQDDAKLTEDIEKMIHLETNIAKVYILV